jgi:hypothetical protein
MLEYDVAIQLRLDLPAPNSLSVDQAPKQNKQEAQSNCAL